MTSNRHRGTSHLSVSSWLEMSRAACLPQTHAGKIEEMRLLASEPVAYPCSRLRKTHHRRGVHSSFRPGTSARPDRWDTGRQPPSAVPAWSPCLHGWRLDCHCSAAHSSGSDAVALYLPLAVAEVAAIQQSPRVQRRLRK